MTDKSGLVVKSANAVAILALVAAIGAMVEKITRPEQTYVAWDQLITPPDVISSVKFKAYIDSNTVGLNLNSVQCDPNGSLFICKTLISNLNLTPALHTIRISTVGVGGESKMSDPIEINFLTVH